MRKVMTDLLIFTIAVVALGLGGVIGPGRMPTSEGLGRRTQCASNLRNIVLGVLQYAGNEGSLPTGTWPNASLPPEKRLSWYAAILPYIECQDLRNQLDLTQTWDGASNQPIAGTPIGLLRCPDVRDGHPAGPMPTPYIGIAGVGTDAPILDKKDPRAGVFGYDRRTTLADIKDGTSSTLVIAESRRVAGTWLTGGWATVRGLDPADQPYVGPGRQFGGIGPAGAMNAAFADGSVRSIRQSIDPKILEALSTKAGGEALPPGLFP